MAGVNRLAQETSPYLRQHADNPVHWQPWDDAAFAEAADRDVPVLLSVGYSSCHWCHVMAHESFEDPETAALMNESFVNVKVDREERPDVDAIYMDAVQAMTGSGGWPMTVFMAPDGRPFFGGTYFPRQPRGGLPSFTELCEAIRDQWKNNRDNILDQAGRLTEAIGRLAGLRPADGLPGPEALDEAAAALVRQHDLEWGGFGRAPKFPQAMSLDVLLRRLARPGDPEADADVASVVTTSLDAMSSGGIYDHLGGGFARYSVDRRWIVPHFEKMLYDNALLARAYLHAWQVTGEARHRQVLDETIAYVLRDLRDPAGGFYSAEDADSEGVEGKFYVWSRAEIAEVCGDDAEAAIEWYGVTEEGNFEGANILWRPERGDLLRPEAVERARAKLFERREGRIRPGLDDKVLTEWNGLFLSALAEAAAATGNDEWLAAAVANGEFLLANLRDGDGRWLRSWQGGDGDRPAQARHLAYAADHAALVDAFTRLAEATGEARWITEAQRCADALVERFWDDEAGGVFTTASDGERLIARTKDLMDNATPSANSLVAVGFLRLGRLTGRNDLVERAEAVLALLANLAREHPTAFGLLLAAVDLHVSPSQEIVVTGERRDLVDVVRERFRPHAVIAWGERYDSPLWTDRDPGLAFVCEGFTCRLPVASPDDLRAELTA
ncbi:MAG: thioredoxin domain-containing protein [Actinomycetota bacterium]|nr:thioredoxin domain-containing protein [Actinomycetota bacterium]